MEKELSFTSDSDKMSSESSENKRKSLSGDKAFGIRDALLVKCRDTIENLNIELDEEKRSKKLIDSKLKDLEHINSIMEYKLRQQELQIIDLKEELDLSNSSLEQCKLEMKKFQTFKPLQEAQAHMQSTVKSLEHSLSTLQEENLKLKQQLDSERARARESIDSNPRKTGFDNERLDLERIEQELEELYEKKHKTLLKDFEKKQEILKEELTSAIDEIELERQRYHEMYKASVDENNQLRQEIKYLQNMLQRKQSQLEKHSQQSLDQLQSILEKKNSDEANAFKSLINQLEQEKVILENEKNNLEHDVYMLQGKLGSQRSEFVAVETMELKQKLIELEKKAFEDSNEKKMLMKNLEDLKLFIHETGSEAGNALESRNVELVKLKYQTLLQAELQKRLRDKQSYKQHLIQDKEAFLSKLKSKDEKIFKLEAEKNELLCTVNYLEEKLIEIDQTDLRIVNEDTARKLRSKVQSFNDSSRPMDSGLFNLETRFSKY